MTEKEMYNFINEQNQETGFAYNEKERGLSNVFSALMRKVYVWMTFALIITGVTALWCGKQSYTLNYDLH